MASFTVTATATSSNDGVTISKATQMTTREKIMGRVFKLIMLGTLCAVYYNGSYLMTAFRAYVRMANAAIAESQVKAKPSDPPVMYPFITDLPESVIYLVALLLLRHLLAKTVFRWLGDSLIAPAKPLGKLDPDVREMRVDRFGSCIFKFLFFTGVTIWGWTLVRDEPWLPEFIYGKAGVPAEAFFEGHPYHPITSAVRSYYMLQLAYHAHSLLWQLSLPSRNDFAEMVLHHICAVFLVAFSYLTNHTRSGTIVFLLHDAGDIVAYAIKASVDTPYTTVTLTFYAALLAVWGYTRLYLFPVFVVSTSIYAAPRLVHADVLPLVTVCSGLLAVLVVLHFYWYGLFIAMGIGFLRTGRTSDIQHRIDVTHKSDGSTVADALMEESGCVREGPGTRTGAASSIKSTSSGHALSIAAPTTNSSSSGIDVTRRKVAATKAQ